MLARTVASLFLVSLAVAQEAGQQQQGGEQSACNLQVNSDESYKTGKRCLKKERKEKHRKAEEEFNKALAPIAEIRDKNITKASSKLHADKEKAYYDFNFHLAIPKADMKKEIRHLGHVLAMSKKEARMKYHGSDNLSPQDKQALQQAFADAKKQFHDGKKQAEDKYDQEFQNQQKTLHEALNKARTAFGEAKAASEAKYLEAMAPHKSDEMKAEADADTEYLTARDNLHTAYRNCKPPQCHHGEDDDDEGHPETQPGQSRAAVAQATGFSNAVLSIAVLSAAVVAAVMFRGRAADDSEEAQPFYTAGASQYSSA